MLTDTSLFQIERKTVLNDISLMSLPFTSSAPNVYKMNSITSDELQEPDESSFEPYAREMDSMTSDELREPYDSNFEPYRHEIDSMTSDEFREPDESTFEPFASKMDSITPDEFRESHESTFESFAGKMDSITFGELRESDESTFESFAGKMDSLTFNELQQHDESSFEPFSYEMDFPLSNRPEKNSFEYFITADTRFRTSFASMSLHGVDRIRFLQFPQEVIFNLHSVVQNSWHLGIQAVQKYSRSHEFKLNGSPWRGQGSDAIPARIVMRSILAYLFSVGWILQASTDVSKKEYDKDTLIFRKQETPPPESEWIAISFNQTNRLRLIGANAQLISAFRTMLKGTRLLQGESWKDKSSNAWEFKIQGAPWVASGEERMVVRLLLLKMMETLERYGWSLYASVDQNEGHTGQSRKTDSWFCVRRKGWDI
jgi:hypothetical protein